MSTPISIFWHRRDLRTFDNAGLYHALQSGLPVLPIFIFDKNILGKLKQDDPRISFIHQSVMNLKNEYRQSGSDLFIGFDTPVNVFKQLLREFNVVKIFINEDYEPYARQRDEDISRLLSVSGIELVRKKDHVVFNPLEILKSDGTPYTVFTPYAKKWKAWFHQTRFMQFVSEQLTHQLLKTEVHFPMYTLKELGFVNTEIPFPPAEIDKRKINFYHLQRDYPWLDGTSRLGVHIRFGTVSIRSLVQLASWLNPKFLEELVWREFYQMILFHFPHTAEMCFKPKYEHIEWRNNENDFKRWCEGKTGYPLVDAGMRQLNATGYMHNRLRMVTASFLTKHLLIDWRWGEAYFAEKLLDYEQASNVGGWQWAAGCGCDAVPYFRVFNPQLQTEKFDPEYKFIACWVPEYLTENYPLPIVNHQEARERALKIYRIALE